MALAAAVARRAPAGHGPCAGRDHHRQGQLSGPRLKSPTAVACTSAMGNECCKEKRKDEEKQEEVDKHIFHKISDSFKGVRSWVFKVIEKLFVYFDFQCKRTPLEKCR